MFHPRRFYRHFVSWYEISVFRLRCRRYHVRCEIGKNTRIRHCQVKPKRDGTLVIGENCTLHGAKFSFYASGGRIEIKDRVFINAYSRAGVYFHVKGKSTIMIGNDCLFSNSIDITTTDWHYILDEQDTIVNPEKNVRIGDHVWIGRKVTVCKGCSIPSNSIIGACSVVTKSYDEEGVIIAGDPAVIKKRGGRWKL